MKYGESAFDILYLLFAIVAVVFTIIAFVAFRIGLTQMLPRGPIEALIGY